MPIDAAQRGAILDRRFIRVLFLSSLLFNLAAVSVGWTNGNLPGCEFRQTQTAISALFIQREQNFSLAYPTPVLGKPWSIPMEFPLYQWTVAWVSEATGCSLTSAARGTSALCFYLSLPAFFLLLRRFKVSANSSLLGVGLILTCPLYVFYARAFLIETMALMFGAWYFYAFARVVAGGGARWLILCAMTGAAASLVKVTTWVVFILPAVAWTSLVLWRRRPRDFRWENARPFLVTLVRLAAAVALPLLAVLGWLHFADGEKLKNPSGQSLTSANLASWNFGVGRRFAPEVWRAHGQIILREIFSPIAALAAIAAAGVVARVHRLSGLVCLGLFFAVQLIFPLLYAWHEYYYVANAFALLLGAGIVLGGLTESASTPRWLVWGLMLAVSVAQGSAWWNFHRPQQAARSPGGTGLTALLKYVTAPDDVLVVVGDDWSSMIPYYSARRALMLRDDILRDPAKATAALELMRGTPVAALVLCGVQRGNDALLRRAGALFSLDQRPAFSTSTSTAYLTPQRRTEALEALARRQFNDVTAPAAATAPADQSQGLAGREVAISELAPRHLALFRTMQPAPIRFYSSVGPDLWDENGRLKFYAHPETRLDFVLPSGSHRLRTAIEMVPAAYNEEPPAGQSDGVTLLLLAKFADGRCEELRRREVNPRDVVADRGAIAIDWSFTLPPGAEAELAVTPGLSGSNLKDWATLYPLTIE